jgi:hypothetical protein
VHGGGPRGRGPSRPERGAGRPGRVGDGGGDVALRGLPAAQEGPAGRGLHVARGRGGVRVAAPRGRVAGGAGGGRPRSRCGRLPRADEGLRGGRARVGLRAGGALRRAGAAGRGGAGHRRSGRRRAGVGARAGRPAATGRRGRRAAAARGGRGGRADGHERERALPRADGLEVARHSRGPSRLRAATATSHARRAPSAPRGRTFGRCRRAHTLSSSPRSPSGARS